MRDKPLVLVVDDEPDFLEIASTKLKLAGFDPIVALNAKEAIDAAGKLHPDLILMDIFMPGETGTDAALAIKQNPKTQDIRIAFLSSLKDPWPSIGADRAILTKNMGMEDFIDKAGDLDALITRVHEILNRK